MIAAFLRLIHVLEATGGNLFILIEEEIPRSDQSLTNCIGFASDGSSAMVGCKNPVWSRLEILSPQCVQLKCTCHSLALCVHLAISKLTSTIGFLLLKIPRWLCNSEIRWEAYKQLLRPFIDVAAFTFQKESEVPYAAIPLLDAIIRIRADLYFPASAAKIFKLIKNASKLHS